MVEDSERKSRRVGMKEKKGDWGKETRRKWEGRRQKT